MQKYQNVVQYSSGTVVYGAQIYVVNYPDESAATIYDANEAVTANPIFTDAEGRFEFYAPTGHYSLQISGPGIASYTLTDVYLEDLWDNRNLAEPTVLVGWNDYVSEIYVHGANAAVLNTSFGPYSHYEFATGVERDCFANFHILHDYANTTDIYPHFHIMTNSTATGDVRIGFEYSIARRSDSAGAAAFTTPATVYVDYNIPANSNGKHMVVQVDPANTIPGTIIEPDTMVVCRIFRDGTDPADTFAASIFGIKADLHYQVARLATRNRDPDFFS